MYAGGWPALGVMRPQQLVLAGIDEALALRDQDRLPVVVERVAVEQEPAPLVDHVEDAPRERERGDRAEPDPESLAGACRRHVEAGGGLPAAT